MREVAIVSAVRTAIGNFGGSLKPIPVVDMGALVIKESIQRAGCRPTIDDGLKAATPDRLKDKNSEIEDKYNQWDDSVQAVKVDEVIMGNVVQSGQGQNTARQSCIRSGLPKETGALTINKVCASGLKALALATQAIQTGDADIIVAGGMENMSRIPFALNDARWGARMGNSEMVDLMIHDGLWEGFYGYHMGITAENIADLYSISREDQDAMSFESHQRALKAIGDGTFKSEIIPVMIPQRKSDPVPFEVDERPMETSLGKMAKLKPAFKKDGTVTAGNASGINDAAAALLVMSRDKAEALGLEIKAIIKGYDFGGIDPAYMGLGPIPAIRKLLAKLNMKLSDIDIFELNEAFASQALACMRELGISPDITNLYGGGISLGHPIGCSGARIVVTLLNAMERNNARTGMASLCIGGGQGAAMIIEKP